MNSPLVSRRDSLKIAASGIALAALPHAVNANSSHSSSPLVQGAGFFHKKIGAFDYFLIADGLLELPTDIFGGDFASNEQVIERLASGRYPTDITRMHVNVGLIKTGHRNILIDTGTGGSWGPHSGFVAKHLQNTNTSPENITDIVITHCHSDHYMGCYDENGELRYPNAQYYISDLEWKQWRVEDKNADTYQSRINQLLLKLEDRITKLGFEEQIISGLSTIGIPGHTNGQIGIRIESEGQTHAFLADIAHHEDLYFAHPDWGYKYDTDQGLAIQSRKRIFESFAKDGIEVSATHFPFPGFGYILKSNSGYRWRPGIWDWD